MLKKLAEKRNTLLIVFAVTFLILWALTLIFGNGEDKTFVLVLSLIFPFVIYGAYRLIFKIGGKNASSKN